MTKKKAKKSAKKTTVFWHPASLVATCFGIGKIPFAPGTWGSLAGLVIFVLLNPPFEIAVFVLPLLLAGGWYASKIYLKNLGTTDDRQEIVIDEFLCQIIATMLGFTIASLAPITQDSFVIQILRWYMDNKPEKSDEYMVFAFLYTYMAVVALLSFITFRLFDILKPWPISLADQKVKGALGVMLDDFLAAIFAGLVTGLVFWVV